MIQLSIVVLCSWLWSVFVSNSLVIPALFLIILFPDSSPATFIALGALAMWHYRLICRGETSVESHINKSETKRLDKLGKTFINPYHFGKTGNWRIFLGLNRGRWEIICLSSLTIFLNSLLLCRSFWRHVLLPSVHKPEGDGIHWLTVYDNSAKMNDHQLWNFFLIKSSSIK